MNIPENPESGSPSGTDSISEQGGGFNGPDIGDYDELSRLYKDDLYDIAKQHGFPATRKHKKHELCQMLSQRY